MKEPTASYIVYPPASGLILWVSRKCNEEGAVLMTPDARNLEYFLERMADNGWSAPTVITTMAEADGRPIYFLEDLSDESVSVEAVFTSWRASAPSSNLTYLVFDHHCRPDQEETHGVHIKRGQAVGASAVSCLEFKRRFDEAIWMLKSLGVSTSA